MSDLHLSPDMILPADAVTQTFAILAKRGMGKTYTASVMAEEMLKAKSQVIIVDPVGVWWGLRSSPDGKSEGLQIVIAGGDHGDIPIEPTNGEILADFVVDNGISIVLDLSAFRKMQQVRFMTDFAESLYRRNRTAVHLILDEADAFAPQRPMPGEQAMLGAIEDIVRRGRARGIGVTMITQRPAVLNKNILTQIEVLVCLRLTAPLDQKAVDEWVKTHAEENQRQEFMSSLPSLPVGTAWFWSPGWLNLFQKVKVRKRETLDSSSTPKIGQKKTAAKLATVDLEKLTEQLQGSISQAQENDPAKLKARIKELEQREPDIQMHQVEVLPGELRVMLHRAHSAAIKMVEATTDLLEYTSKFSDASDTVSQFSEIDSRRISEMPLVEPVTPGGPSKAAIIKDMVDANARQVAYAGPRKPNERLAAVAQTAQDQAREEKPLTKAARTILGVLAQYPAGRTRIQVAILSGYSKKSSSFSNALGELRSAGLISAAGAEPITTTDEGQLVAEFEPLPTGQALIDYWLTKLTKAEASMLRALTAQYPAALNYDQLQEMTGYSRTSSSFSNALGKLRSLELVTKSNPVTASRVFFEGKS